MGDYEICDECGYGIYPGDYACLIHHGGSDYVVHESCAQDMLDEGTITQEEYDDAIDYDVEEQHSYDEQYRDPWSW